MMRRALRSRRSALFLLGGLGVVLLLLRGATAQEASHLGGPPGLPLPPEPPTPVVKLSVRVPACFAPSRAIEYCICVENCSRAEAHHVVVKNPLPANATFLKSDPEPARRVPELQWHLGTVGAGATRDISLWLLPTDQDEVKNCARVQFEHGQCVVTRPSNYLPGGAPGTAPGMPDSTTPGGGKPRPFPPDANNPEKKGPTVRPVPPTVDAADAPKLNLTAQGHKQQYLNLPSRYFFTVTNPGTSRTTNVLVTATLPGKAQFLQASDQGTFLERQVAWFVGNLDPGQSRTVDLVLKSSEAGEWCVKAMVRADRNARGEAEACTQFLGVSALTVEMADRDDPLVVGGKTSYPILIRQQGSAPLTNVRVKALIPATLKLERTQPAGAQPGENAAEGQWVNLPAIPRVEVNGQAALEIFVEALRVGEARLHVEVYADQLERHPVVEEEHTTIFDDEKAPRPVPKL